MHPQDLDNFMDISDLKGSAKFFWLVNELIELQVQIEALKSLAALNHDSYAVPAAIAAAKKGQWYQDMHKVLHQKLLALRAAQENPEARLQAMLKAKLEGRL